MQISINVEDSGIANQILKFLQTFNQKIQIETVAFENKSFDSYKNSQHFIKDKNELHKIFNDIKLNKSHTYPINDEFWDEMDRVIDEIRWISEEVKTSQIN